MIYLYGDKNLKFKNNNFILSMDININVKVK